MTASRYFNLNVTNDRLGSPIARDNSRQTALNIQNFFAKAAAGLSTPTLQAEWDAAAATDTLTFDNVTGSGVGGTINTVACTAASTTADSALTAERLKVALNADETFAGLYLATRSSAVVTVKALIAGTAANSTGLTGATGVTRSGSTMSGGALATGKVVFQALDPSGDVGATINGHLVKVTWDTSATHTGDLFVTALEADPDVGGAFSSASNASGTVTITITNPVNAATANAYTLVASGGTTSVSGATFGTGAGTVAAVDSSGTFTVSCPTATGRLTSVVGATTVAYAASDTDDDATAALVLAKILAGGNTPNNLVSKNVTATLQTKVAATGVVRFNGSDGTVTGAAINSTAIHVTSTDGDDQTTADDFADAVNASVTLNGLVTAVSNSNASVTLTAATPGTAANSLTLVAYNASTVIATVSAAMLLGGLGCVITCAAKVPGFQGNLNGLVAAGTGTTAGAALFTGGTATQETFAY